MTASEMIEELKKYDGDTPVVSQGTDPFSGYGSCLDEVSTVEKRTEGYVTTGDDGKLTTRYGEVVVVGYWRG